MDKPIKEPYPDRFCRFCDATFLKNGKVEQWWDYMVIDTVWELEAGLGKKDVCCLPCLEKRLVRPLTYADFTPARCNNTIRYLLDRDAFLGKRSESFKYAKAVSEKLDRVLNGSDWVVAPIDPGTPRDEFKEVPLVRAGDGGMWVPVYVYVKDPA